MTRLLRRDVLRGLLGLAGLLVSPRSFSAVGERPAPASTLATIASLRARPRPIPSSQASIVEVEGYYRGGDGGGGRFVWSPASQLPDDGGTVIASADSGAAPGRWVREAARLHVRMFGARSGTDCTDALERALAAHRDLDWSDGRWQVRRTLRFADSTRHTGENALIEFVDAAAAGDVPIVSLQGRRRVRIRGMRVAGLPQSPSRGVIGFDLRDAADCRLERVEARDCWGRVGISGQVAGTGCSLSGQRNQVLASRFENCTVGLLHGGSGNVVRGNYFCNHFVASAEAKPWTPASYYWDGLISEGAHDFTCDENVAEDNGQSGLYFGGNGTTSSKGRIRRNHAERNWNRGIDVGLNNGKSDREFIRDFDVSGNVTRDNRDINLWIQGIDDSRVCDNRCDYTADYDRVWRGMPTQGTGRVNLVVTSLDESRSCNRNRITGNRCRDAYGRAAISLAFHGTGNVVTDNVATSASPFFLGPQLDRTRNRISLAPPSG